MSIDAMKQAVRVMGLIGADLICEVAHHEKKDRHELGEPCPVKQRFHEAFETLRTALRTAIEQAERDWSLLEATQESLREHMTEIKRLKQRQWVGLTDEEKRQIVLDDPIDWVAAIEAKLKEKNETT
jgi:hypothetical protein